MAGKIKGGVTMATTKKPMTKAQIVSHFAETFELPKKSAAAIIEELATLAVAQTKKTGEFTIPGIGKLVKTKRKARMGRNPATCLNVGYSKT